MLKIISSPRQKSNMVMSEMYNGSDLRWSIKSRLKKKKQLLHCYKYSIIYSDYINDTYTHTQKVKVKSQFPCH